MKIIQGDLIKLAQQGYFDVIVHGCNCYCVMGAGIAKTIKNVFPYAYTVDCQTKKGDKDKLGDISFAVCESEKGFVHVVNAYTQFGFGGGINVDYNAIRECMKKIKNKYNGKKIGLPKIGAGLGGGDWDTIFTIIKEELKNEDVTIVEFKP